MSTKILSVFIDESGDFGPYNSHCPYYIVSLTTHNQNIDISNNIKTFDFHLKNLGYENHAIHTGPLIRRESIYINDLIENRKRLFNALFNFTRKLDIRYSYIIINKSECSDIISMTTKISKELSQLLYSKKSYWYNFDKIIIYYDNGQVELTKILIAVFNTLYTNIEFRKVKPIDYKLFQVSDLVCTMILLELKCTNNSLSKSELEFFDNSRNLKKNYIKYLKRKIL